MQLELGIKIPGQGFHFYQFYALFGIFDKPCKADILNMKSASSFFGCTKCRQKGKSNLYGNGQHVIFPYEDNVELRSKENYKVNLLIY